MTPKVKAVQLVDKYMVRIIFNNKPTEESSIPSSKECALLCVDEMISELLTCMKFYTENSYYELRVNYLNDVRKEIQKIWA